VSATEDHEPPPAFSTADWLTRIATARGRGDHLHAYDLASQALHSLPDDLALEYQAILALARLGALGAARSRYAAVEAAGRLDGLADAFLASEFAALAGRLWKDLAERSRGAEAGRCRLMAAEAYRAAYERFGGFFPAINAASLYLALGRREDAVPLAQAALDLARRALPGDYWVAATKAEALLILGDPDGAAAALAVASALGAGQLDRLATTRKQLTWVAALTGAPAAALNALAQPRVLAWDAQPGLAVGSLAPSFGSATPVIAFGSVLSAADIATAGVLLDAGVEVNCVLPCAPALILSSPICHAGPDTARDFEAVMRRITDQDPRRITLVTPEGGPFEPAARLLCRQQAHGLARLRASSLAVTPELLRLDADGITCNPTPAGTVAARPADGDAEVPAREPCTILFGDVRGFSQLTEAGQLLFLAHIIGGFADVLDACPAVDYVETAGDGLFIVLSDILAAVDCAFALQGVLRPEHVAAAGLPGHLGLRLSAHVGPLYKRFDRVIRRDKFCGMEVIRTARIEPVTPVGEIFVTKQFAATLAAAAGDDFICEYVGVQAMAKGFGDCPMYSLRRAMFG
jgi:class 3 adenylate cyclase/tetratricopeptide (TPR) repeat protein